MRNFLTIYTLALSSSHLAIAHALPEVSPAPTALTRRDDRDDRIESSLSSLVSSATSALGEDPDEASSILSELREQYTSIAGEATGCGSSWARITNTIDEFDEGFFDGVFNVVDEIFSDGDECRDGTLRLVVRQ